MTSAERPEDRASEVSQTAPDSGDAPAPAPETGAPAERAAATGAPASSAPATEVGPSASAAPASATSTAAAPAGVDTRPWSLWAIASLVCWLIPIVPVLLGVIGLIQTRDGRQRGRLLALGGILASVTVTTGAFWFIGRIAAATRPMTTNGPTAAINLGIEGQPSRFLEAFWLHPEAPPAVIGLEQVPSADLAATSDAPAAQTFLDAVRDRYGTILTMRPAEQQDLTGPIPPEGTLRIRYEVRFERGTAPLEANLVVRHPDRWWDLVLAWGSVAVYAADGTIIDFPTGSGTQPGGTDQPMKEGAAAADDASGEAPGSPEPGPGLAADPG